MDADRIVTEAARRPALPFEPSQKEAPCRVP
jgi:hypothetical protein